MEFPASPEFVNAPVVETVLGVEFAPLTKWQIPHFGLYWQTIRDEFPDFAIQPALTSEENRPTREERLLKAVVLQLLPAPPVRCWFHHKQKTGLLQVQQDRFIHNWRKADQRAAYPRYESIRPVFAQEFQRFQEFETRENLGTALPRRCEVTYVNHLVRGREWRHLADVRSIFEWFAPPLLGESVGSLNGLGCTLEYPLPSPWQGHLAIQVQHAVGDGQDEFLQFTLSAKGEPRGSSLDDTLGFFDLGHQLVVDAFTKLTSPQMHGVWKRGPA